MRALTLPRVWSTTAEGECPVTLVTAHDWSRAAALAVPGKLHQLAASR